MPCALTGNIFVTGGVSSAGTLRSVEILNITMAMASGAWSYGPDMS
jgi:hypothetical protein